MYIPLLFGKIKVRKIIRNVHLCRMQGYIIPGLSVYKKTLIPVRIKWKEKYCSYAEVVLQTEKTDSILLQRHRHPHIPREIAWHHQQEKRKNQHFLNCTGGINVLGVPNMVKKFQKHNWAINLSPKKKWQLIS